MWAGECAHGSELKQSSFRTCEKNLWWFVLGFFSRVDIKNIFQKDNRNINQGINLEVRKPTVRIK